MSIFAFVLQAPFPPAFPCDNTMSNIRSCTYSHQAVAHYHYTSTFIPQNQLPDPRQFRLKAVSQVNTCKRVARRGKTKQKPRFLLQPQLSRGIITFPSLIGSLPAECRAAANLLKSKEEYDALRLRVAKYLEMGEQNHVSLLRLRSIIIGRKWLNLFLLL